MELDDLLRSARDHGRPVILLEGTRDLPDEDRPKLVALAAHLAQALPEARFRTGNARGTDTAFAEGVRQASAPAAVGQAELPAAGYAQGPRRQRGRPGSCALGPLLRQFRQSRYGTHPPGLRAGRGPNRDAIGLAALGARVRLWSAAALLY
jgi:hypothetical protein